MARSLIREEQVKDIDFVSHSEHDDDLQNEIIHKFIWCKDLPFTTYSGHAGESVVINDTADGLDLVTPSLLSLADVPNEYKDGYYLRSTASGFVFDTDYIPNLVYVHSGYVGGFSDGSFGYPFKTLAEAAYFINTTYSGTESVALMFHPGEHIVNHKIQITNPALKAIIGSDYKNTVIKPTVDLIGQNFIELYDSIHARHISIDATDIPEFATVSGSTGVMILDNSFQEISLDNIRISGFFVGFESSAPSNIWVRSMDIIDCNTGVCLSSGTLFDAEMLYIDGAKQYHIYVAGADTEVYLASSEFSSYYVDGLVGSGTAINIDGAYCEIFSGTNIWSCNKNIVVKNGGTVKVDNCVLETTFSTPGIIQEEGSYLYINNSRAPLAHDDISIASPEFCYINAFDSSDETTVIGNSALTDQTIFSINTGQSSRPALRFEHVHNVSYRAISFFNPNVGENTELYAGAIDSNVALGVHPIGPNAFDYVANVGLMSIQDGVRSGWDIGKCPGEEPDFIINNKRNEVWLKIDYSGNTTMTGTLSLRNGKAIHSILDEDNMVSNSTEAVATQQSIKAYVDNTTYSTTALNSGQLDSRYYTETEVNTISGVLDDKLVHVDGSKPLTDNWDAGDYEITASGFNVGEAKLDLARYLNSTGLLSGGNLSINTIDNTKIDIAAGNAIYVDMTDRENPFSEIISWDDTYIYPSLSGIRNKWVGIERTAPGVGEPVCTLAFSQEQKRSTVILGRCWGEGTEEITGIGNYKTGAFNVGKSVEDIAYALGVMNLGGNVFFPTGSGLMTFGRTAGEAFRFSANYIESDISPNIDVSSTVSGIDGYQYHVQNSLVTIRKEQVDSDYYDLDGVLTPTPSGCWTTQLIYYFPVSDVVHIVYGQHYHEDYDETYSHILHYDPVLNNSIIEGAVLRSYLIIKQGCVDLTDTNTAVFIEAISSTAGGGGGGGVGGVTDHGGLTGLLDDDHTQYMLKDGSRNFSAAVKYTAHPTFDQDTQIVDKKYVDDEISEITTDHGELIGLSDDDHPQYLNTTRGDIRYNTKEEITTISGAIVAQMLSNSELPTLQVEKSTTTALSTAYVNVLFDTTSFENYPDIIQHDDVNTGRILIKEDGLYYVFYSIRIQATSTTTYSYARLYRNETQELDGSYAYVRTYASEIHELTGCTVVNLSADDYLVLQAYRSSDGSVNALDIQLNVIKLSAIKGEQGDQGIQGEPGLVTISGSAYFDAYDSIGGTVVGGTWVDVPLDTERKNSGNFTVISGTTVEIPISNTYHISARVTTDITSGTDRSDCKMRLVKYNGSIFEEIPGSLAYIYNRTLDFGTSTASVTIIDDFEYEDQIKIQVTRDSGTSTIGLLAGGSSLSVHIPGGMPGADGTDGHDGAPGSGSTLIVKDAGINVTNTPHSAFNFTGNGVSVSDAGSGVATISIPGITIQDESSNIIGGPHHTINFTGASVSAYDMGSGVAEVWVQPPTFGTWYAWSGEEAETSTNSTSPVQKSRLSLTGIPTGYYRVEWYYEWRRNSTSYDYIARIQIDDINTIMEQSEESQDTGSWHIEGGFCIVELASGDHYIDFDHYGESTSSTSYTRRLRLEIWRVV